MRNKHKVARWVVLAVAAGWVCANTLFAGPPEFIITTVAGTGKAGFSGDGGPAVEAQLNRPSAVAVDGNGNLYIADLGNVRIRKVDSAGKITTFAGTGEADYSGDGGPAAEAGLRNPYGVCHGADGIIYISDQRDGRIRAVSAEGVIRTVAGTGLEGDQGSQIL